MANSKELRQDGIDMVGLQDGSQLRAPPPAYPTFSQESEQGGITRQPTVFDPAPNRIDYQIPFGSKPIPIYCPVCQQKTTSKVDTVTGGITW